MDVVFIYILMFVYLSVCLFVCLSTSCSKKTKPSIIYHIFANM